MTSLDEISFKLGELTEGQRELFKRMDRNDKERSEMRELLRGINTKLDPVVQDHAWMKPQVKSYSRVRRFGGWAASAVVTLAGIVGGSVTSYAFKKWGGR